MQVLKPDGMIVSIKHASCVPLNDYQVAFRLTLLVETGARTYDASEINRHRRSIRTSK